MKVGEVLARPELGLSLLTGQESLDREVASIFTTDLLDPSRYLQPAALVLTGLMWRRSPADSEVFVAGLASAGVVGLAAGEAAFDGVPDDLVAACARHHLPLLAVPVQVSFADVSAFVLAQLDQARDRGVADQLTKHRRLVAMVARGLGMDELVRLASTETGVAFTVLTSTGRCVAAGGLSLVPADVDRLIRAHLTADRLPAVATTGGGQVFSLFAVDSPTGQRLTGWFIACGGDYRTWDAPTFAMVRELASAVSLERARLDEGLRFQRRIADEVIGLVATGHTGRADVAVRLRDLGIDPAARFAVVVASSPGRPDFTETARMLLDDVGRSMAGGVVSGCLDGRAIALLSWPEGTPRSTRCQPGSPGSRPASAGVGWSWASRLQPVSMHCLERSTRPATRTASPTSRRGRSQWCQATRLRRTSRCWLRCPTTYDERFATRLLGAVLEYDRRHGSELVPTLETFLRCAGSWNRCAAELHVHVNTVRYRVRRVEELTHRDLSRIEDQVDVFLALRSLGVP